jgi:DNA-binding MarR family transcriptional regulator
MTERTKQLAEELTRLHYENPVDIGRLGAIVPTRGEDIIVFCLYSSDGALLAGELGERTGLSTGRISNILRQLEGKGLVRRLQDEHDHRRVHVSLTEKGRAYAQQLETNAIEAHGALLERLGAHDAAELVRIVRRCIASAHEVSG